MRRMAFVAIGILMAVGMLVAAPSASAARFMSGENMVEVSRNSVVDDDLFIAGEKVVIDGTVNGDLFVAGQSIVISGKVGGNVYAAGEKVTIAGTVDGGITVIGQVLELSSSGRIGGGVIAAGESVSAESGSKISGGALFAASIANWRGTIGRGLTGAGGQVTLAGAVGRDAYLRTETLQLNSGTVIRGNLNYGSEQDLVRNQGTEITGSVKRTEQKPASNNGAGIAAQIGFMLWSFASMLLVGLVILWVAPSASRGIALATVGRPVAAFGCGLLAFLLTLPAVVIMLFTLIGIPLALLILGAFVVALYCAQIFVALAIGQLVSKHSSQFSNRYLGLVLGLLIIMVLELVPYIGPAVSLATMLLGLGGMIVYWSVRNSSSSRPPAPHAKSIKA